MLRKVLASAVQERTVRGGILETPSSFLDAKVVSERVELLFQDWSTRY